MIVYEEIHVREERSGGTNMKIIVVLKQLPDEEKRQEYQDIDKLNDSDINVLKEALDLRDIYGGEVSAILFGPPRGEDILKEAFTYGIDHAILVCDESYKDLDISSVTKILAEAIYQTDSYDLILCGRQAIDGDSAHMAAMLAGALKIPLLAYSSEIRMEDDGICTLCEGDMEKYQAKTEFPVMVLSVKEKHQIRFPKVEDIMKTYDGTYKIDIITDEQLNQTKYQKKVVQLRKYQVEHTKKKNLKILEGVSDAQKAEQILKILKQKNILSGEEISESKKKNTKNNGVDDRVYFQTIEKRQLESNGIVVIAELCNGKIFPITLELIKAGRELASQMGLRLSLIIVGHQIKKEINTLYHYPIDEVVYIDDKDYIEYDRYRQKEAISYVIHKISPRAVFIGATALGRVLAGEIAFEMESELIVDASKIRYDEESDQIIISRPAFDGENMADFKINTTPAVITIRSGVMGRAPYEELGKAEFFQLEPFWIKDHQKRQVLYQKDDGKKQKEINLSEEKLIVCGGRGMKGKEGFLLLDDFADKIGGQVGCTRPCVDAGWAVYKQQIGQSGISVRPKLYLGFGVAGALQHVTGIDADCMIAVNDNPRAAIFQYCDYGIVADARKILKELLQKL